MKILFLGSLISSEEMEKLNNNSSEKASVAPVNYETMLVKGLTENEEKVECLSIPAVAAYPHSKFKTMPSKQEKLFGSVSVHWLPFINVQFLKQKTIEKNVRKYLKKWLIENASVKEKAILMYSIYPPYTKPAIELCRKYHCHLSAIITDLPEYMYSWKKASGLRGWYSNQLSQEMLRLQTQCDSYILFTKPMASRMGIEDKPYMVSEGFSDSSIFADIPAMEKYETPTIVYGGNLSKLYGIRNLVDAFMLTEGNFELHLYGSGSDVEYIKECAKKDARIKYYGRVSRTELLMALKKAHLLVINKPTADDYSNYSFSSKILEYMTSSTPVLTTRVGGMLEEYYPYVYFIEDESLDGIKASIENTINIPKSELNGKGFVAAEFTINEKGYRSQTNKIVTFLEKIIDSNIGNQHD